MLLAHTKSSTIYDWECVVKTTFYLLKRDSPHTKSHMVKCRQLLGGSDAHEAAILDKDVGLRCGSVMKLPLKDVVGRDGTYCCLWEAKRASHTNDANLFLALEKRPNHVFINTPSSG